jgi:hypothetical protein
MLDTRKQVRLHNPPSHQKIDVFYVFGDGLYAIYTPLEKTFFVLTAWLFLSRARPGVRVLLGARARMA